MRTSVRLVQGTDIARLSRGYSGARAEFASVVLSKLEVAHLPSTEGALHETAHRR